MWEFIIPYLPLIRKGFIVSITLASVGAGVGLLLAILLAIGDLYGGKIIKGIVNCYVEFFRGSSLIAQLFILYFAIPTLLNIQHLVDWFTIGLIGFTLNSGAYSKGYVKGAMDAVYEDQMTAARSVGLSKWQAIIYVVLPQALRMVIPAWTNEYTSCARSTAGILVIGGMDLTAMGRQIAFMSFRVLETYTVIALIYLAWLAVFTKILDIVYKKVKIPGVEAI